MTKFLPALLGGADLNAKLDRLLAKVDTAKADLSSAELLRSQASAEFYAESGGSRAALDKANARVTKSATAVAELEAAVSATRLDLAEAAKAEAAAREAQVDAAVRKLGDERQALMEALAGDVEHVIIARMARACDIGREIASLRGAGQHTTEIAPGTVMTRVLAFIQARLDVAADATRLPPTPLVEQFATGEQIAEMATRGRRTAAPVFATRTDETGRHKVRVR